MGIFGGVNEPDPSPPQVQAKTIIDPSHPEAGRSGVVPPAHARFAPGVSGNPGGRPKGHDPRAVLMRRWSERPNEHGEGARAVKHADDIEEAIATGDDEKLDRNLKLLHEVAGKPREHLSLEQVTPPAIIIHTDPKPDPKLPI